MPKNTQQPTEAPRASTAGGASTDAPRARSARAAVDMLDTLIDLDQRLALLEAMAGLT